MHNETLPPMPVWEARSFYVAIAAVAIILANSFGVSIPEFAGIEDREGLADVLQDIAPLFLGAWGYIERRAPNFRLIFGKVI